MKQPKAGAVARITAANSVLDRAWGKAAQRVVLSPTDALTEVLQAIDGASRGLPQETKAKANGANGSIH